MSAATSSVPVAALGVSLLVLRGGFHRVEHVLLVLGQRVRRLHRRRACSRARTGRRRTRTRRARAPADRDGDPASRPRRSGTTLAPWGLAFIQSYAVDKRLEPSDLRYERIDVVIGAVMTGVIGFFIVVACAATLHASGRSIEDASDAAARARAAGRRPRVAAVRRRAARRRAARRLDPAALDGVLGQRGPRRRVGARRLVRRRAGLLRHVRRGRRARRRRSSSSPARRWCRSCSSRQALNAVLLLPLLRLRSGIVARP